MEFLVHCVRRESRERLSCRHCGLALVGLGRASVEPRPPGLAVTWPPQNYASCVIRLVIREGCSVAYLKFLYSFHWLNARIGDDFGLQATSLPKERAPDYRQEGMLYAHNLAQRTSRAVENIGSRVSGLTVEPSAYCVPSIPPQHDPRLASNLPRSNSFGA